MISLKRWDSLVARSKRGRQQKGGAQEPYGQVGWGSCDRPCKLTASLFRKCGSFASAVLHTCVPRWLAKGPVLREAIGYGGFVEPGDCVPSFLRARKSRERNGKKANEFLPLADI